MDKSQLLVQDKQAKISWAVGWALISSAVFSEVAEQSPVPGVRFGVLIAGLAGLCVLSPILLFPRGLSVRLRLLQIVLPMIWTAGAVYVVSHKSPEMAGEIGTYLFAIGVAAAGIGLATSMAVSVFDSQVPCRWRWVYSLITSFVWACIGVIGVLATMFVWYIGLILMSSLGETIWRLPDGGRLFLLWSWPLVAGGLVGWAVSSLSLLILRAPRETETKPYLPGVPTQPEPTC